MGAHGFIRATADLDIVPAPDPDNIRRLSAALDDLEATLPTAGDRRFDPTGDLPAVQKGSNITTDTRFGGLDVLQRALGVPQYEALVEDSVESDLLGIPVQVCSLKRLREMKRVHGRAQDIADLENLPDDEL